MDRRAHLFIFLSVATVYLSTWGIVSWLENRMLKTEVILLKETLRDSLDKHPVEILTAKDDEQITSIWIWPKQTYSRDGVKALEKWVRRQAEEFLPGQPIRVSFINSPSYYGAVSWLNGQLTLMESNGTNSTAFTKWPLTVGFFSLAFMLGLFLWQYFRINGFKSLREIANRIANYGSASRLLSLTWFHQIRSRPTKLNFSQGLTAQQKSQSGIGSHSQFLSPSPFQSPSQLPPLSQTQSKGSQEPNARLVASQAQLIQDQYVTIENLNLKINLFNEQLLQVKKENEGFHMLWNRANDEIRELKIQKPSRGLDLENNLSFFEASSQELRSPTPAKSEIRYSSSEKEERI